MHSGLGDWNGLEKQAKEKEKNKTGIPGILVSTVCGQQEQDGARGRVVPGEGGGGSYRNTELQCVFFLPIPSFNLKPSKGFRTPLS